MCGQCRGLVPDIDWYSAGLDDSSRQRHAARVELARAARELVPVRGFGVDSYPGSVTLTLTSPTGGCVVVSRFQDLVAECEALIGREIDPLHEDSIRRRLDRSP